MSREGDFYEAGGVTTEMRREMEPSGRLGHVGAGCWCRLGAACPESLRQMEANLSRPTLPDRFTPTPEEQARRTEAAAALVARVQAPPTPAAMLGEVLGHVQRALAALAAAGLHGVGAGPLRQEVVVGDLRNAERNLMAEIEGAKREAEAREGEG